MRTINMLSKADMVKGQGVLSAHDEQVALAKKVMAGSLPRPHFTFLRLNIQAFFVIIRFIKMTLCHISFGLSIKFQLLIKHVS